MVIAIIEGIPPQRSSTASTAELSSEESLVALASFPSIWHPPRPPPASPMEAVSAAARRTAKKRTALRPPQGCIS